jgi:enterochelin esterase-like enzyme
MTADRWSLRRRWWLVAGGVVVIAIAAGVLHAVGGHMSVGKGYDSVPAGFTVPAVENRPRVSATSAAPGRLQRVYFYSRALHRIADYLVYLPPSYTPARRLPVFYGLHGMPGRPLAFTVDAHIEPRLVALIDQHRVPPMILVFPDGRIGGRTATDSEWANTPSGDFLSYVGDVVHDVDHRFATLPDRQDRAIAGLSAGAYGAANVGLHDLSLFGVIQVWSGYFVETHNGVFAHASPATMRANSPLDYVGGMRAELRRYPLRAFLYVGRDDDFASQLLPMVRAMRAAGTDVGWAVYRGGHSWNVWSGHLDQMLIMAGQDFEHPLARPG